MSVYSTKAKRRKLISFQGQRLKALDLKKAYWYLNKCGQALARTTDCLSESESIYMYYQSKEEEAYLLSRSKAKVSRS